MNENFGQFIKQLRKKHGLTQKDLAKKLNISDKAVSKWELSDSYPDISLLKPLSLIFNITIDELINCELNKVKDTQNKGLNIVNSVLSGLLLLFTLIILTLVVTDRMTVLGNGSSLQLNIVNLQTFETTVLIILIIFTVPLFVYNVFQIIRNRKVREYEKS